ncbi:RNaseH domain-containing protein [Streptomyces sp. NPDC048295]|uniref:RNaseH domain-containing protein n=1 Tax=Streptomyces sp. NPDC048295 TaxID=3154617 RepID=UPI0034189E3C
MGRRSTQRDLTAHTTSIKCTPQLLDGMTALVWDFGDYHSPTRRAWRDLGSTATRNSKRIAGVQDSDPFLIPYSIAVTVLQQITDGYVYLDRNLAFMVTLSPVEPGVLKNVFTYLEGIVRRIPLDEIPFMDEPALAKLVAGVTPQSLSLAENILAQQDGRPASPDSWAYQAVKWHIAKKLAAKPLLDTEVEPVREPYETKDGVAKERIVDWQPSTNTAAVHYRPDSDGDLIAWDHPIGPLFASLAHPVNISEAATARPKDPTRAQVQYAMSRVSVKMATYTAEPNPVLNLNAHIRRVNNTVVHARTALLDQGTQRPLLSLSLDGWGLRQANKHALEILAKLDADRTALTTLEERVADERHRLNLRDENGKRIDILTPAPGTIRPTMPKTDSFAVGTGAGIYQLSLLQDQIRRAFGDVVSLLELKSKGNVFGKRHHEPVTSTQEKEKKKRKSDGDYIDLIGNPSPDSIRRSIEAAGYTKLRILCLWYRDETLTRMIHGLAHPYGLDPERIDPDPNGKDTTPLAEGIEAVFCNAETLLKHGPGKERASDADALISQFAEPDVLLAAWCETELPVRGEEHEGMKPAEVKSALAENDAKHQVVRELAKAAVPSQFLVGRTYDPFTKSFSIVKKPAAAFEDHRVYMGQLDLYRSCGVIDDRFERALYPEDDPYPLPRMAFVGIHIRKQATDRKYKGQPKRIITVTAVIPSRKAGETWRMLGWSNIHPQWEHYARAQSNFHASNYPLHTQDGQGEMQRWAQAGEDVRTALQDLSDELDGLPYALMIDGHASRRVWPGLHNNKQGLTPDPDDPRLWLPGSGLPASWNPVSIIRMNCAQAEMPRLVSVTEKLKNGTTKPLKTSSDLYYPEERPEGHPWFLFTEPRNYGKKRHGQWKTRWRADPGKASKNADERKENELNSPWYSMTTREITPMYTRSGYEREALAVAAARLSHQALSWSDRTRYPAPLHAALQMDLGHPQFRRSEPKDQESIEILKEACGTDA